jgi:penicillin amidase
VDGEERLAGLAAAVTVRRDAVGVPHLEAASLPDLFRAQGYVTAQDRLWQMDLLRRRARGELAEAFGEAALRLDREMRTLGLGRAAGAGLEALPADARAILDAYSAGVNAFIDSGGLPLEFRLLRYRPRPWTPADTVVVGKLLAYDLALGWEGEAQRAQLRRVLPPELFDLLHPARFAGDRVLFGADPPIGNAGAAGIESTVGSNNWVVSGAHTATGKPLLANDPHLALGVPSIWTAVHLRAPGLEVAGVTLPGAPGVILGRNRRLAWGCTNVHDDSADLYTLEVDPRRPDRYRTPEGDERFRTVDESIPVRRGALASSWDTVAHQVRLTRWGPVTRIGGGLYALRWTTLESAAELPAFMAIDRAADWKQFRDAVALFPGPSQNFVYADAEGHIAWYSAGRLPIRRASDGAAPHSPTSRDGDWVGFVPFDELPRLFDPPSGRIVTANNRLVGSAYRYRVTRGGIGPWRAAALFEALESREGWTTDDMARLQGLRLSIPHRELAEALRAAAGRHHPDPRWREIAEEMNGFDGHLEPESRPAAYAVTVFRLVGERVLGPRLEGLPFARSLRRRTVAIERLVRERPREWLPSGTADWDGLLLACWEAAGQELRRTLGDDRGAWTLGRLNEVRVRHPLSRALAVLGPVFDTPEMLLGGASTTPNVLGLTTAGAVEGPSMRFVANLADPDDTRLVNFMGQSGHVASPHYADQLDAWREVGTHRLAFTPEAVASATRHTLRLVP